MTDSEIARARDSDVHPGPNVKMHRINGEWDVPPMLAGAYAGKNRTLAVVWCRYCDRHHTHGAGNGGRVAHCGVHVSPYRDSGYLIQMRDDITPEDLIPPRAERRRPKRGGRFGTMRHGWDGEPRARWVLEAAA